MRTKFQALAATVLLPVALLLEGCAGSGPQQPRPEVHRVAVIPVVSPANLYTENKTLALPLLPALIVQSIDNGRKSEAFDRRMTATREAMGAKLTAALLEELKNQGFEPFLLENVKRAAKNPADVDYTSLDTKDPVVYAEFSGVGMYSSRTSNDYEPQVNVWAFLKARPDASDWLAEGSVHYGADSGGKTDDWHLPADTKYRYRSFDELIARADEVSDSYDVAIRAIAQRIAKQLRAQP